MGIIAAYSLVPYKTPWLVLSLILPLVLMTGYVVEEVYQPGLRAFTAVIVAGAASFCVYQAIDISFVHFDDNTDNYPYVYAHTFRDFLSLINEIDNIADANPAKKKIGITVVSPEHWPMPWYLRDYPNVGYYGHVVPSSEAIVIALKPQVPEVQQLLGANYHIYSTHDLRPGNTLVMFVRSDVKP
jgi:predicted membrane-bound mannosyltransferase